MNTLASRDKTGSERCPDRRDAPPWLGHGGFLAARLLVGTLAALFPELSHADWPMLHGNARHDGYVAAEVSPPFKLGWARYFVGERLGTAMEPIVAGGRVFVATHQGSLYALDAVSGEPLWRFEAHGAFLHSPAFADQLVIAASADGCLYGVEAETGRLRWRVFGGDGGFSASPTIAEGTTFIGTRGGEFLAVTVQSGAVLWRERFEAPVRQTAAVADGRVFVTAEDLRVRCLVATSGKILWTSDQLSGQTARDYYPIVVRVGGRTLVVVRTNPVINMAQRIARDRRLLAQNAGADDSDWRRLDAWIKSDAARGTAELWAKEQGTIVNYLESTPDARTFFVLDALTGRHATTAPVLWVAGCQGVGAQPALTSDGRLLVFHRSAYGNWNHGVAPLVALGLLDLAAGRITPLFHQFGRQPAWNTFWGTADESQNFVVAGSTVLIVHQGTLSGFELNQNGLFHIWGERDTYGGFRNPPWARNEWHGPGRGAVAVDGNHIYWLTGSRALCVVAGEQGQAGGDQAIEGRTVDTTTAPRAVPLTGDQLRTRLQEVAREILSRTWAPLLAEPGLAGREFFFDHSGEVFEALAWAFPHLTPEQQRRAATALADLWEKHRPFTEQAWLPLKEGARRERFWVPEESLRQRNRGEAFHPFGNVSAVWLHAERCGAWDRVLTAWPQLKRSFEGFVRTGWRLEGAKGDRFANRYLAALLAFERIADKVGDTPASVEARKLAGETAAALAAWWRRAAKGGSLGEFHGVGQLDPFIGKGDALSFRLAPHRHKLALLHDLTPEVAALVAAEAPEAVAALWRVFETLYATWDLVGEERQVHFGENFVDTPDLAYDAFRASAWLRDAPPEELARRVDLPFCRGDLYYLAKLGIALEGPVPAAKSR